MLSVCRASVLTLLLATISACSVTPTAPPELSQTVPGHWPEHRARLDAITHWRITGKIGIRTSEQNESAVINNWTQIADEFDINLSSAFLGLGATHIQGSPNAITLQQGDEPTLFSDQPERLIWEQTGWLLPLASLPYWIKGLPAPNSSHTLHFDHKGQLASLNQDDWNIAYHRFDPSKNPPLPTKIKVVQDGIIITLIIKSWEIQPREDAL